MATKAISTTSISRIIINLGAAGDTHLTGVNAMIPHYRTRRPTSPGEILVELYLAPHSVSIAKFAEAVGVSRKHMSAIANGRASITAKTATRMAAVLGTTAQYWLNLQNAVDLYEAEAHLAESKTRPQPMPVFG